MLSNRFHIRTRRIRHSDTPVCKGLAIKPTHTDGHDADTFEVGAGVEVCGCDGLDAGDDDGGGFDAFENLRRRSTWIYVYGVGDRESRHGDVDAFEDDDVVFGVTWWEGWWGGHGGGWVGQ